MQTLQINSILQGGKYRIDRVLGQGGFGITYLAEQVMLHRKVAIKEFFMKELCNREESTSTVSVPSVGSAEMVARFKEKFIKEASLIASLNHHNIVQIFDIFEENGTAYYVMEYIDGSSLDGEVKQGALPEGEALGYIRQVADALSYIHDKNVLHLDVKPANILLRNNEAVLIDFGISKRYDADGGQTSTTSVGISKGYAPMEQYNQGMQKFTPATDIYSLGATLYKLLTGQTPPEASKLLNEEEELEKPANVSFATWTAVEKAMEPKVKRRPQNVADFLSLLGVQKKAANTTNEDPQSGVDATDETEVIKPIIEEPPVVQDLSSTEREFLVKGVKFKMIKVEGGTFDMRERQNYGFLGLSSKIVIQNVTLRNYYIGATQVTQELWEAVMGRNPSCVKGANRPVETVSWYDCQTFISKLNSITGQQFRLSTEAEWEFAARGGNKSNHYKFSGSDNLDEVAWHYANSERVTHDVATKKPNELGIYDMSGNVGEWCSDRYGVYNSGSVNNPSGPDKGDDYVIRGGGFLSIFDGFEVYSRDSNNADSRFTDLGFRLALSI